MIDFDDLDTDISNAVSNAAEIRKNAHKVNGGEAEFQCPACKGRGKFISYSGRVVGDCFKCKGNGKVSKRVAAAAKAKVTRAENLERKREEFAAEHADVIDFIRRNVDWSNFYRSMCESIDEYGRLTEGQLGAVRRGMEKQAERAAARKAEREANAPVVDVSAIERLFETARENGLKKMRFNTDRLVISPAPAHGRNAGAIYVKDNGEYAGKIVNGKFMATNGAQSDTIEKLNELATDPAGVARFYGRQTGVCCCCGRELTDPVSVANGIGPICESNWGL